MIPKCQGKASLQSVFPPPALAWFSSCFLFPHSVLSLFFLKSSQLTWGQRLFYCGYRSRCSGQPQIESHAAAAGTGHSGPYLGWKTPAESTGAPLVTSRVSEGPTEVKTLTSEISGETTQDRIAGSCYGRWKTLTSDRPGVEAGLCLFPAVHTLLSACGIPQETPMGPTEVQKGDAVTSGHFSQS